MAQRQLLTSRERSDFLSGLASNDLERLQERRIRHEEMIAKAEADGNTHAANVYREKIGMIDWMIGKRQAESK